MTPRSGKRLRRLLLAAVLVPILLVAGRGLRIGGYEPRASDAYLWGVFHVHSTLSDGLAPVEEIAEQARSARVSFVLLSDHGAPQPEAATLGRTIGGVRFIGGSEVGLPDGHLIVSDVEELPRYTLPPYPPDAVSEVERWGGLAVVTYPEDPLFAWSYWEEDFVPHGIEIVNVTSYFRAASLWRKLDWALFSPFNSAYYITAFEAPAYALERWDELLSRGKVLPFYAVNAHGGFPLTEETNIAVPSYATAFGYVGLGVARRYAESPEEAIRRGEFFAVVRAAGEPDRFELSQRDGKIVVLLEGAPGRARIDLKHGGRIVASSAKDHLRHAADEPGAYRAEVYLEDHPLLAPDVPWILSNAVFVGEEPRRAPPPPLDCGKVDPVPLEELRLEMDDASRGTVELTPSGALKLSYHLSKSTKERVDRWVALSFRERLSLSDHRGLYVRASSPERMRYWVEIRAGDEGHYASVATGPEELGAALPWSRFYPTVGAPRDIPLAGIDSLFVTVNTSNSQTGFDDELTILELGFCR